MREGRPRKHEIDRRESHVEVMVQRCKGRVKLLAHFFALQGPRCSVYCQLSHCRANVNRPFLRLQGRVFGNERLDFVLDQSNVGVQGFRSKAKLDELNMYSLADKLESWSALC